eukprot:gnl/Hemi2/3638_TR1267_c0_g1_i1.p1 gnl/Hemi2/3638_TR1267_c0_g1~~gnl/Hemi2/3638_TR1267_c0_g1_i1.p1  ORF type:complete len:139 (+),score=35.22 gnl/Hemi2/3638_TR1267_c0_g1_i1:82-498(+)
MSSSTPLPLNSNHVEYKVMGQSDFSSPRMAVIPEETLTKLTRLVVALTALSALMFLLILILVIVILAVDPLSTITSMNSAILDLRNTTIAMNNGVVVLNTMAYKLVSNTYLMCDVLSLNSQSHKICLFTNDTIPATAR